MNVNDSVSQEKLILCRFARLDKTLISGGVNKNYILGADCRCLYDRERLILTSGMRNEHGIAIGGVAKVVLLIIPAATLNATNENMMV